VTHLYAWRWAFERGAADNTEFRVRTGAAFSLDIVNHRMSAYPAPQIRSHRTLCYGTVNRDNSVSFQNLQLQIERAHWRGTLAGCNVMVHQHLEPHRRAASAGTLYLRCGHHVNPKRGGQRWRLYEIQQPDISLATKSRHFNFAYYHRSRTHLSLAKDSPVPRPIQLPAMGPVVALPQVGGLHHRYERRAA
jgi:hypothetical protein